MNWVEPVITFFATLVPHLFRKKSPQEIVARELRRELRRKEKEFRRKESEAGRAYSKNEKQELDEIRRKYLKALMGENSLD